MTLPLNFWTNLKLLGPVLLSANVRPSGTVGPVAGKSFPFHFAWQLALIAESVVVTPSAPSVWIVSEFGELSLTSVLFQLPINPVPGEVLT